MVLVIIYCT